MTHVNNEDERQLTMSNQTVPIVYSVNNLYAPYLYISLQSLKKHTEAEWNYQIYILYTDLEKRHIKRLENLSKKNVEIQCVDVSKDMEGIDIKGSNYLTAESCYRLLLPDLFPQYSKMLYIDADTLILEDVKKLFKESLKGKTAGVIREAVSIPLKEHYQSLGINEAFNAGIMLIDMELFREREIGKQCLELLIEDSKQKKRRLRFMDQDALNVVLKDQVHFINQEWNFLYQYMQHLDWLYPEYQKAYLEASSNIRILHYVSEIKPWEHPEVALAELFWEEARKTPYYEEILFRNIREKKEKMVEDFFRNHLFPFDKLPKGSRIALYGAGNVGCTLNAQNNIVNYVKIVLWVDKNYDDIEGSETIYGPEKLMEWQALYEYILIAIDDPAVCESVEKNLLRQGIPQEKIVWSKYRRN